MRVVVCAAGLGDDVQAIKAGILEIADVLAVNKSDLPGAETTLEQLNAMLALREESARDVTVCATTATTGGGVPKLAEFIERRILAIEPGRARSPERVRRLLAVAAGNALARELRDLEATWLEDVCGSLQRGEIDLLTAAQRVLERSRGTDE